MSLSQPQTSSSLLPPVLARALPYYILALAAMLAYSNVYDNAALYDDEYLILGNRYLRNWHSLGDIFTHYLTAGAQHSGYFYRPLQNALYLIIAQLSNRDLFGFHFINVALHAANGCLVYHLGRKLNFNSTATFLAALIWVLHPLHTEAITYMSGTADPLYVFFCLTGINILLPDFSPRRILLAALFMVLGLLSKETAIIFPLLAASCLYLANPERLKLKTYLRTWPLWLIAGAYLCARLWIAHESHMSMLNIDNISQQYDAHIYLRFYTFLATLPAYLALLLYPAGLHMDRDFHVYLDPYFLIIGIGLFLLLAAIAQIFWGKGKRGLPLSWGLMWFASAQIPHTGLALPVNAIFLEHWMYLPSVGLFLGVAETIAQTFSSKIFLRSAAGCAAIIAFILGVSTYEQNKIWHDPFVFYMNIINHGETSVRARNNLGIAYMNAGDYSRAMELFRFALKDTDLTPETHQNIASLLSKTANGDPAMIQQEIRELNRALDINPNFQPAYIGLADIYTYLGDDKHAAYYRDQLRQRFGPQ